MIEAHTLSYDWQGARFDSPSVKYLDDKPVGTNFIVNPSAEGSVLGLGQNNSTVALVADTGTAQGTRSYKVTTSNLSYAGAGSPSTGSPASPGTNYWGRVRCRLDSSLIGNRRMVSSVKFFNSAGAQIGSTDGPRVDLNITGTYRRWTGTADASTSEEFTPGGGYGKRVNLEANPGQRAGIAGWGPSANWSAAASSDGPLVGPSMASLLLTRTSTTPGNGYITRIYSGLTINTPYTISVYVKASVAGTYRFGVLHPDFSASLIQVDRALAPNMGWQRVSMTFTPTQTSEMFIFNDDLFNPTYGGVAPVVGQTIQVSGILLESGTALLPYFDGSLVTPLAGKRRVWTGAAGASASLETSSDGTQRVNYATFPVPSAVNDPLGSGRTGWVSRWFGNGGAGTNTYVTGAGDGPIGLTSYSRKTWTTVAAMQDIGWSHTGGAMTEGLPVVPGETITLSTYIRTSRTMPTNGVDYNSNRIVVGIYDATGASVFLSGSGTAPAAINAGQWTRFTYTFTVPANGAYMANAFTQIYLTGAGYAAGDTLDGTGLLIERSSSVGAYFDGSEVWPAQGNYRAWAAAPNASGTIQTAPDGSVRTNRMANPGFFSDIDNWSGSGRSWDATNKRMNSSISSAVASGGNLGFSSNVPATAGDQRRYGLMFYNTSNVAMIVSLQVQIRTAANNTLGYLDGAQSTVQPGQSVWLTTSTGTSAFPPGTNSTVMVLRSGGVPAGVSYQIDSAIDTELGNGTPLTQADYFDANSQDSALVLQSLSTGVPNLSVFELTASAVAPAGTASVAYYIQRDPTLPSSTVNDVFYLDNVLLTDNADATAPSYFDGDFDSTEIYVNVPRPGEITVDDWLEVDGVPLNTLAWNITTLGGRLGVPGVRGANVTVPGRPGAVHMDKEIDSQTYTLNMWALGCKRDGSFPTDHESKYELDKNIRTLRSLLFNVRRQVKFTKRWFDADVNAVRSAVGYAEYAGGLDPAMTGRTRATFSVDLALTDPFFYEPQIELSVATSTQRTWHVTPRGDWRTTAIVVKIQGPRVNPKITVTHPDGSQTWVQYLGTLAATDTLVIDVDAFTATLTSGGSSRGVTGNIRHGGAAPWLTLEPGGDNTVLLESTSGVGAVSVYYQPVWF
jgi:hypothetical protein